MIEQIGNFCEMDQYLKVILCRLAPRVLVQLLRKCIRTVAVRRRVGGRLVTTEV
jgi:hypothetical protein